MKSFYKSKKILALVSTMLLIMVSACKKQQSDFEKVLIDKRKCWAYYTHSREQIDTAKMIPLGCTRFYEDGDMQVMSMDGNKDKPKELYILDEVHTNEVGWSFNVKDSTLGRSRRRYLHNGSSKSLHFVLIQSFIEKSKRRNSYTCKREVEGHRPSLDVQ